MNNWSCTAGRGSAGIVETTDDEGEPVTLTVMICAHADGRVVVAAFGSFLNN